MDLIRETFDVVVMNPPFGEPSGNSRDYIEANYGSANRILTQFL